MTDPTITKTTPATGGTWLDLGAMLVLLVLSAVLLLSRLGSYALWEPWEGEHAVMARESLEQGAWLQPQFHGETRWQEPPLHTWAVMVLFQATGPSEWNARLPSAAMGIVVVAFLFFVLRRLQVGRAAAFLGAVVLLTTPMFTFWARHAMPDMTYAGFLALAMLSFALGRWRAGPPLACALATAICLGLATLAKGWIAPAIFLSSLLLFFLPFVQLPSLRALKPWLGGFARRLRSASFLGGMGAFLVVALPWYLAVYSSQGSTFWEYLDDYEELLPFRHVGRQDGTAEYYFQTLVHGMFPWIGFVPVAFACMGSFAGGEASGEGGDTDAPQRAEVPWFFASFFLAPLVIFSMAYEKESHFLLPLVAPMAGLVAILWDRHFSSSRTFWIRAALLVSCLVWYLALVDFDERGNMRVFDAFHKRRTVYDPFLLDLIGWFFYAWIGASILLSLWRRSVIPALVLGAVAYGYAAFLMLDVAPGHTPCRTVAGYVQQIERFRLPETEVILYGHDMPTLTYYLGGRDRYHHFHSDESRDLWRLLGEVAKRENASEVRILGVVHEDSWDDFERALERVLGREEVWLDTGQGHFNLVASTNEELDEYDGMLDPIGWYWLDLRRRDESMAGPLAELPILVMRRALQDAAAVMVEVQYEGRDPKWIAGVNALLHQLRGEDRVITPAEFLEVADALRKLLEEAGLR